MNARPARLLIAGAVSLLLVSSLALTGCSTKVVTSSEQGLGTVTASGSGKVSATPDMADMSFGGTAQNADAKAALAAASKTAAQISAAVQKAGVDKKDIQTQSVSVYPVNSPDTGQITGYQAALSVMVKVRNLEVLGDVISAATNAGATTVNGPTFDVSDRTPYTQDAIDKAVEDARKTANALAKAAGKSVGQVLKISTAGSEFVPVPMGAAEVNTKDAAAGVPIEAGQLEISENVTVVFELK